MSDHYLLSCTYNNKKITVPQQFLVTRNSKLLTKHTLNQYFSNNEALNTIFNYTDTEIISILLINETSLIINCIAPAKKI